MQGPSRHSFSSPLREATLCAVFTTIALLLSLASCTCGESSSGEDSVDDVEQREAWVDGCVRDPQQLLGDARGLAGKSFDGRRLPADADQLLAHLLSIPEKQLQGTVDWSSSARFVILEPFETGRPLLDGLVLQLKRPAGAKVVQGDVTRRVETSDGVLHLEARGDRLRVSLTSWALSASRRALDAQDEECAGDMVIAMTPMVLSSQPVKGWIARQGAWLESSARQGTARHGRSDIGDPEVAARKIARWAETRRESAEKAAPLRATISLSSDSLHLELRGRRTETETTPSEGRGDGPGTLGLVAPDAYLALSSHNTAENRRERAASIVDIISRVAGDRMTSEERGELEAAAQALAEASEGWSTFALRPSLEAGPLVALASIESPEPQAASQALRRLTELLAEGHLHRVFEQLGVDVGIAARDAEGSRGRIELSTGAVQKRAPDAGPPRGPSGFRLLLGERPTLSWEVRQDTLLVAFGQEPERELARMTEALDGEITTAVTGQPVMSHVAAAASRADFYGFLWAPAVVGLVTQGGPGAQGLHPGGMAIASGPDEDPARWRSTIRADQAQVQSILRWIFEGGGR